MSDRRRRALAAVAMFLILTGVYALTNSGRIDSIDGQYRWEVCRNLLDLHQPTVEDPALYGWAIKNQTTGKYYANYNAGASVTPMPLMAVARALASRPNPEADRFAFALTGAFFGALVGALLVVGYSMLGLSIRASMWWSAVFCLATLWWPGSVTVLDQNQHAAFAFASLLLAWQAGRKDSFAIAACAGFVGGMLFNFQENYGLILPTTALAVFAGSGEGRDETVPLRQKVTKRAVGRYLLFGICSCVGLALFVAYLHWKSGEVVKPYGGYATDTATAAKTWGNPFVSLASLVASPGKSVFLFSPPLVLAFFGGRTLAQRAPMLFWAGVFSTAVHLLLVIQLAFFAGDWCWGPRYVLVLMPFWALAFPFAAPVLRGKQLRVLAPALVALGLAVQVLGISFDYHRFFFERNLPTFFYVGDPWFYFRESQLVARPFEVASTVTNGIPPEATVFAPTPTGTVTYTTGSNPPEIPAREWMRHYAVWYAPWPWPLWIRMIPPDKQPITPAPVVGLCAIAILVGGAGAAYAARGRGVSGGDTGDVESALEQTGERT